MPPKVAIVGRPNVGKSSLLNMLARRTLSIVDPTAGVTRDRVGVIVELPVRHGDEDQQPRIVELIDTGGYGIEDSQNLTTQVEQQIAHAVGEADLILFVVDAQTGLLPLDRQVGRLLHGTTGVRVHGKVLLVVNKVDDTRWEAAAYDAMRLGFGDPVFVSANTRHGEFDLLDAIRANIDPERYDLKEKPSEGLRVAIVGKRNAGKSTLVNALAGSERVIVSDVEGTTRDSVDVRLEIGKHVFTLIDTAGMRRRGSLANDIEFYSYHRSLRSIRRADVVLLLIDSTVPTSVVDRKLGNEIQKHFKPVAVVVNKWDLVENEHTQEEYIKYLDKALKGLDYAPVAFISAKQDEGVKELPGLALSLHKQATHRVPTAELNRVVRELVAKHPPAAKGGRRCKLYYVTQLAADPPTIGLFVNEPGLLDPSYQRYLLNHLRDELPFAEVPIRLLIRARKRKTLQERRDEQAAQRRADRAQQAAPAEEFNELVEGDEDEALDVEDFDFAVEDLSDADAEVDDDYADDLDDEDADDDDLDDDEGDDDDDQPRR